MLQLFGKIFGSEEVISKGLELIDDAFETEAEERESKAKQKINLLNAYAPFKLAQRYIAMMFTFTFLICFFTVLACTLFEIGKPDEVIKVMETFSIEWIMGTIVLFYFGGGLVDSVNAPRRT